MKKSLFFMLAVGLLISVQAMFSDWKLNAIYNESDLRLDGAFRLKNGKAKTTFVDKNLKSAKSKKVSMIGYKVVTDAAKQGHLCIAMHSVFDDKQNQAYELCFDSQATHSIAWNRSKAQEIGKALTEVEGGPLHARAKLKKGGTVVAEVNASYSGNDVEFDLTIKGDGGVYGLRLSEILQ
jgi:hypothetical protein